MRSCSIWILWSPWAAASPTRWGGDARRSSASSAGTSTSKPTPSCSRKRRKGDACRAYLSADLVAELREHLAKVDALRVAWAQACKAAGRPGTIFHDLRRSGVRNMVRAGVSETVAMKISGHCNSSLFRRYNITSDEDLRAVAERMGMSSGITEPGVSKTRLVSMRSS